MLIPGAVCDHKAVFGLLASYLGCVAASDS